jgi:16S rRNA (adenine1518-N6/adenine1519-N6)-dimethyltransferase
MNNKDFYPKKSLGQNFLIDPNIIRKIAGSIEACKGILVIEIGAGKGALTAELAEKGHRLRAIEIDDRLIPELRSKFESFQNVEIIQADILEYLSGENITEPYVVIGNLPYYITTPIIMGVLDRPCPPQKMVFMMQREVADRIVAEPGGKIYGALSVFVQVSSTVELIMDVPPTVFRPAPAVLSAVLSFSPHSRFRLSGSEKKHFDRVVKAAFAQRRKTVQNSLGTLGVSKDEILKGLESAGIAPSRRAETVSVAEFVRLARAIVL